MAALAVGAVRDMGGPPAEHILLRVLAGEVRIDYRQRNMLREGRPLHPIMENVMAIHVAEAARHISFAHEYLCKRIPQLVRRSRFVLSLYVPIIMRVLGEAIVVPPRSIFKKFDIPRSVRKELSFEAPALSQTRRDMYGDVQCCATTWVDEPGRAVDVAHLQDRRSSVAVSG